MIEAIIAHGGEVVCDHNYTDAAISAGVPHDPPWFGPLLRSIGGKDLFQNAMDVSVEVADPKQLEAVASLPYLTELSVGGKRVNDESLKLLKHCQRLPMHGIVDENPSTIQSSNDRPFRNCQDGSRFPLAHAGVPDKLKCFSLVRWKGFDGLVRGGPLLQRLWFFITISSLVKLSFCARRRSVSRRGHLTLSQRISGMTALKVASTVLFVSATPYFVPDMDYSQQTPGSRTDTLGSCWERNSKRPEKRPV